MIYTDQRIDEAAAFLAQLHGKTLIVSHIDPDGDTLGAAAAMLRYLKARGAQVSAFCVNAVPKQYRYDFEGEFISELPQSVDNLIVVDCADAARMGAASALLQSTQNTLLIDHHYTNPLFCKLNCVDSHASSTCEILERILTCGGNTLHKEVAQALYVGIVTDSGQFSFDSVSASTFVAAAACVDTGADFVGINNRLFRTRSMGKTRLIAAVLSSIEYYNGGMVAVMYMDKAMLKRCSAVFEDGENLINYGIETEGCMIAALLKEQSVGYKASIRTAGEYDAGEIAAALGGGGHKRAAGCTLSTNRAEAQAALMRTIEAKLGCTLERDN